MMQELLASSQETAVFQSGFCQPSMSFCVLPAYPPLKYYLSSFWAPSWVCGGVSVSFQLGFLVSRMLF